MAAACAAIGLSGAAGAAEISGAGATFPYPIYAKWAEAYKAQTGTSMNYQSIGSGGGIKQITAKTVDFGASDMPMKPQDLDKNGLLQWPQIMGGVVLVVHLQGIAPLTSRTDGAIGYVDYAYALQNKMAYTQLRNQSGAFVSPNSKTFQSAAANADWSKAPGFYLLLTNQPGAESWPITGASFILMHKQQADPAKAKAVINFFDWAYRNGSQLAEQLDYVPIPEKVVGLVEQSWKQIAGPDGKPVWTGSGS